MKKGLKVTLIILGFLVGIIVLDTLQAKIFKNSSIISWKQKLDGDSYVDKGLLINTFYCVKNKDEVEVNSYFKTTKYTCPISRDENGLYLINKKYNVYSDEYDPVFMVDNKKVSIKDYLTKSNSTPSYIHNNSDPILALNDGGTLVYEYQVENTKYYFVECHKILSKYNGCILIGKDYNKLLALR